MSIWIKPVKTTITIAYEAISMSLSCHCGNSFKSVLSLVDTVLSTDLLRCDLIFSHGPKGENHNKVIRRRDATLTC